MFFDAEFTDVFLIGLTRPMQIRSDVNIENCILLADLANGDYKIGVGENRVKF